ncbi:MAG: hypothetical protein ACXV4A_12960 [Actinomycetes bacterium]|jgi:hypothetical protein
MQHDDPREKVRRAVDEAARPEDDHEKQERNSGIAIAVLAIVVALLLIGIVSGATGAFRP